MDHIGESAALIRQRDIAREASGRHRSRPIRYFTSINVTLPGKLMSLMRSSASSGPTAAPPEGGHGDLNVAS